jgi:hypothetical protein
MKVEINVPENLSEVRLEQYQKYVKLITDNEVSDFVNQKTLEIFCNLPLTDVIKISYNSVDEILKHLNTLFTKKYFLKSTFELYGKEFGFIPNLEDITFGEYIDLDTYLKDVSTWHKAMAVLYRPINRKIKNMYLIDDYNGSDDYAEIMKDAPVDIILGAMVFFYTLGSELLNDTMDYLQAQKLERLEITQGSNNSQINMDGINQSMESLKEISQNLIWSPSFHYTSV